MRTRDVVSPEKLRGGFYSPEVLVKLCLDRARALLEDREHLRVLEPAAGDGGFIRGLADHDLGSRVGHVEAIELFEAEAAKTATTLERSNLPGRVTAQNVLEWYDSSSQASFDLVLANPPYVRFQFISEEDKQRAKDLSEHLGVSGSSVSNLWIPVFLLALNSLRDGGVFSVILPTEFLTGVSASRVRAWLLANTADLSIDLFKPGSFPAVLQEVLVLSGRRVHISSGTSITFTDHNGGAQSWQHTINPSAKTWTAYLLSPPEAAGYQFAQDLGAVRRMGALARFSVSTVTGANAYFCLPTSEIQKHNLKGWALPLLARSRLATGLVFTHEDHERIANGTQPAWILSFSANRPDPADNSQARRYIQIGEGEQIHTRYKTRIRAPWYRVPIVPAGEVLLSKRSNEFPRVISNHARAFTTDTIYRGQMLAGSPIDADDLTASFHNSLTLLSAEIEGRSFGGGVLELVPSEVASLLLPVAPGARQHLSRLDAAYRASATGNDLIEATDEVLAAHIRELTPELMGTLRQARSALLKRRLVRSNSNFYAE